MANRRVAATAKLEEDKNHESSERKVVAAKPSYKIMPILWHTSMVAFYVYFIYLGEKLSAALLVPGRKQAICGLFKYIPYINVWLQLLFFSLQLTVDITDSKSLQRVSSFIFTTMAFPISTSIVIIFWPIYLTDHNLIFPDSHMKAFPWYMNHFWHSAMLLWVLLEVYLVKHHFPSNAAAIMTILLHNTSYDAWILFLYFKTGSWVYPFFARLSHLQILALLASGKLNLMCTYFLGKKLTSVFWGPRK